jgi:hypothetical protein
MKHNQFLRISVIALVAVVLGAASLSSAQETVATNSGTLAFTEAPSGEGLSAGTSPTTHRLMVNDRALGPSQQSNTPTASPTSFPSPLESWDFLHPTPKPDGMRNSHW